MNNWAETGLFFFITSRTCSWSLTLQVLNSSFNHFHSRRFLIFDQNDHRTSTTAGNRPQRRDPSGSGPGSESPAESVWTRIWPHPSPPWRWNPVGGLMLPSGAVWNINLLTWQHFYFMFVQMLSNKNVESPPWTFIKLSFIIGRESLAALHHVEKVKGYRPNVFPFSPVEF